MTVGLFRSHPAPAHREVSVSVPLGDRLVGTSLNMEATVFGSTLRQRTGRSDYGWPVSVPPCASAQEGFR